MDVPFTCTILSPANILHVARKWVGGSSPNLDFFFFFGNWVFLVFFVLFSYLLKKKLDRGVGVWYMTNPSFFRILNFLLDKTHKTLMMISN